jgi:hypothetical protein
MGEPQMKSLTVLTSTLMLAVALSGSDPVRAQSATPTGGGCAPKGGMSFVCGAVNVEDFLPVEGGRWLVAVWLGTLRGDRVAYLPAP